MIPLGLVNESINNETITIRAKHDKHHYEVALFQDHHFVAQAHRVGSVKYKSPLLR
jgi:hypothetical protein